MTECVHACVHACMRACVFEWTCDNLLKDPVKSIDRVFVVSSLIRCEFYVILHPHVDLRWKRNGLGMSVCTLELTQQGQIGK